MLRPAPAIDVVVVSYNSRDTLRACLEPLAGLDGISVIVVDNASADHSLETIADLPVRTVASEQNRGFAAGCNLGLAAGNAPFVLFLNPDAYIGEEAMRRLAAVLVAESNVGIVGPRTVAGDGALVPSMRRYQRVASVWAGAFFVHRFVKSAAWANEIVTSADVYEHAAYPEWLSGGCFLVRRPVIESVGGFDEGFFLYNEDMDLCARVRAAGYKVRYEPTALVRHEGGRSAPRTGLFAVLARSRMRFARQHAGLLSVHAQRLGLAVGALTHAVVNAARPAHRRGHVAALRVIVGSAGREAGPA
jgi:N-acetylglucosaminyl-diphospho-decaprenol L-rhamnosyltransferase